MSLPPMTSPARGRETSGRSLPELSFARLFGASFAVLKRGFAVLVLLGAIPATVGAGSTLVMVWLFGPQFLTSLISLNPAGLAGGPLAVIAGVALVTMLVAAQCCALVVHLTNQIAAGARPEVSLAWRETTSILARVLPPYLFVCAAGWLLATLTVTWFLDALRTAARSGDRAGEALLAFLGQVLLAGGVLAIVILLARVRLFLFLPVAGREKLSGFTALRRSWQLTRGDSWTILGAIVLVGTVEGIAGGLAIRLIDPLLADPTGLGGGGLGTVVSSLMPTVAATAVIGAVISAVTLPLLTVMSALVHRLRTQPAATVPPPGAWTQQQPYPGTPHTGWPPAG